VGQAEVVHHPAILITSRPPPSSSKAMKSRSEPGNAELQELVLTSELVDGMARIVTRS
jgi:hypothetical protein